MSENKKPLTNSWLEKSHKTSESGSLHIHFNDFKIGTIFQLYDFNRPLNQSDK